jgi:hypothetical protein
MGLPGFDIGTEFTNLRLCRAHFWEKAGPIQLVGGV